MGSSSDEEAMNEVEMDERDEDASGSESDLVLESDVKLAEASQNAKNDRDGLREKLEDIVWPKNAGWIHTLSIDIDQAQEVDVNDDLARELAFYTQALEGTRKAFEKLESMGLPFLRPPDYYAEMVKSDVHMEKVKGRLLAEKRNIEESEDRRKARDAKRLAKEVQAQKLKERAMQKKSEIEAVKKWRKQREQSGFAKDDEQMDLEFEDGKVFERSKKQRPGVSPGDRSGGRGGKSWQKGKNRLDKKKGKREARDSRFGFGGKKGLKKQNTADSTDDFRGLNKEGFVGNKRRKK